MVGITRGISGLSVITESCLLYGCFCKGRHITTAHVNESSESADLQSQGPMLDCLENMFLSVTFLDKKIDWLIHYFWQQEQTTPCFHSCGLNREGHLHLEFALTDLWLGYLQTNWHHVRQVTSVATLLVWTSSEGLIFKRYPDPCVAGCSASSCSVCNMYSQLVGQSVAHASSSSSNSTKTKLHVESRVNRKISQSLLLHQFKITRLNYSFSSFLYPFIIHLKRKES